MQYEENKTSISRFNDNVEYYAKYRPNYPQEVMQIIKNEFHLDAGSLIADIGSGTGIFTKLLLDKKYQVLAIEPNTPMRHKAEQDLSHYTNFTSYATTAEATGLDENSIDCITVATAFHWFNKDAAKKEFLRILKPDGWCLLVWNLRDVEASPYMRDMEALFKQYGIDYTTSAAEKMDEAAVVNFFKPTEVTIAQFSNHQLFDWEGLKGRLLSISYLPKPGMPDYEEMESAFKRIFDKYQTNGQIAYQYQTKCYYSQLKLK